MTRRRWPFALARVIPAIILDQPWAVFVKGLCIVSGLTTFAGPAPGSIEATLPRAVTYAWSTTLVLGASASLYGLLRARGARLEIAGCIWLGTASLVYAGTLAVRLDAGSAVAAGIVAGFGLAALVRALAVYVSYAIAVERVTGDQS